MFKPSGHGQFDKLLEKATSHLLLEPDWGSIMQICDLIRQKDCHPKYAVAGIKKKLYSTNPHVIMFGLQVMESVVKNCGTPVQDEVATKSFMEEMRELTKGTPHENVREKILELLQTWANAFRKMPSYRAVQDVVNIMKTEGAKFPPLAETDAMFVADTMPEWAEGDVCHRCRTEFGLVNRKHHCRACGQIFCSKCSSKLCTLPKFGIEKEVRVCDACYEKNGKPPSNSASLKNNSSGHLEDDILKQVMAASLAESKAPTSSNPNAPKTKTEEELAEEEQLQLALAISQSEAEAKALEEKKKGGGASAGLQLNNSQPVEKKGSATVIEEDEDPGLARYLNRNYWENIKNQKEEEEAATSKEDPMKKNTMVEKSGKGFGQHVPYQNWEPSAPGKENNTTEQADDSDDFVENLKSQIEMFLNRMKANSSRGRPISYDTSVQGLFMNITALHPQLLSYIQAQVDARAYYERLQDKMSEVSTARTALDALRKEHSDRLRREAEQAEQYRKKQIYDKLTVMREQKQQYLQYQRHLLMQKMQEQERLMQMRIDQQSQLPGGMPYPGQYGPPNSMPGGYLPNQIPGLMSPPTGMQAYVYQGIVPPGQYMQQPGGPIPHSGMGQQQPPPQMSQYNPQSTQYNMSMPQQQQQQQPQTGMQPPPQSQQQQGPQMTQPPTQMQNHNVHDQSISSTGYPPQQQMHQQQQQPHTPQSQPPQHIQQQSPQNQQQQYYQQQQQPQQNQQPDPQGMQQHQQQQVPNSIQSPHNSQSQIQQQPPMSIPQSHSQHEFSPPGINPPIPEPTTAELISFD